MTRQIQLDDADRATLYASMVAVNAQYGVGDFHDFFYHCWRHAYALPTKLSSAVFDFRLGRSGGAMLIKGLHLTQAVPPTPGKRGSTWSAPTVEARKLMCVVLSQLGHIYNFSAKKDFDYIDDVFPIYADRDAQLGTNRSFLEWHVEDGFHPAKADLAALYCLGGIRPRKPSSAPHAT